MSRLLNRATDKLVNVVGDDVFKDDSDEENAVSIYY